MMRLVTVSLLLLLPILAFAQGHKHPERWYQEKWCSSRGQMEVIMPDMSRADCMNATHIVEFDFGKKWAESIGQALNYGAQSGKVPGIVLILERPGDERYLERVKTVRATYGLPLEIWTVDGEGRER
ncbi:MAG: hypothetical protein Q7U56_00560 [Humidesulfovibrio sp.]|nr:hypothetical protein [Humidesulfovibrio sp.]